MQFEIKHLDVVSVIKVCFILYAIVGLVIGFIYLIVALIFSGLMGQSPGFGQHGLFRVLATGFGVLLIPLVGLVYGCLGALGGLVFAVIYNLISRTVGGIRIGLTGDGLGLRTTGHAGDTEMRL